MIFSLLTFSPIIIKIQMANSFVYLAYYLSHSFFFFLKKQTNKPVLYSKSNVQFCTTPFAS